ncbi:MAG TPA: hypothetical protein VFQ79_00905 [Bryobacteraceae bacterium]|nr:hypothetical protein [Bryobacteraceae bacterium]
MDLDLSRFEAQTLEVAEGAHPARLRVVPVERTANDNADGQQDDCAQRTYKLAAT